MLNFFLNPDLRPRYLCVMIIIIIIIIGYLNNIYHWISARQNSHGKSARPKCNENLAMPNFHRNVGLLFRP
jgi:hypothetical protein